MSGRGGGYPPVEETRGPGCQEQVGAGSEAMCIHQGPVPMELSAELPLGGEHI